MRRRPGWRRSDPFLATWYGGLLGGLVPVLLVGFVASALADRLAFVAWALALAAAWTLALRHGMEAGWPGRRLAGALALVLALGLAAFAALEVRHGEILELGFRAVLPGLYRPFLTSPVLPAALAGALALVGAAGLALSGEGPVEGQTR